MFTFLVVLIAIIGILLGLVVLLQSGKGGGLAGIAAGGTTQVLGARQAPDILEKATWSLAAMFVVLCILTNFFIGGDDEGQSVIQQRARSGQTQQQATPPPGATQNPVAPGQNAPSGAPAQGQANPATPPGADAPSQTTPQR